MWQIRWFMIKNNKYLDLHLDNRLYQFRKHRHLKIKSDIIYSLKELYFICTHYADKYVIDCIFSL